jgi:hypothetical protein
MDWGWDGGGRLDAAGVLGDVVDCGGLSESEGGCVFSKLDTAGGGSVPPRSDGGVTMVVLPIGLNNGGVGSRGSKTSRISRGICIVVSAYVACDS